MKRSMNDGARTSVRRERKLGVELDVAFDACFMCPEPPLMERSSARDDDGGS